MKKVIITVGPMLLSEEKQKGNNNYIYRINGAHGSLKDIECYIKNIKRDIADVEVLIDLPGNKIRTANLEEPVQLKIDKNFSLLTHQINYKFFYKSIRKGDIVLADDSTLKFVVEEMNDERIIFTSKSEGLLFSNKGLHVKGIYSEAPFLFQRDKELIELSNKHRVSYIGLSFVRTVNDINIAKELIDNNIKIISKIETKAAVDNLNDILQTVDYILVDRGDLSTEVGLEKIPSYQKFIVEKALFRNKKVFLATQFLKNMVDKPIPSIAEIVDLYNTFKMGVYGIQLSEETAIGKYPMKCLEVINNVIREIDSEIK